LEGSWALIFALSAAFLTLTKPIGIYFSLSAILINVIATLFTLRFESTKRKLLHFAPALASLVSVATVWMAWGYFLASWGSTNSSVGVSLLSRLSDSGEKQYVADITSKFIGALFQVDLNPTSLLHMPASMWTITCIVFFAIWIYLNGRCNIRRNVSLGLTLLLITAGYLAVILNAYVTSFSVYEATNLASFQRYIATWYQGIFFATILLILSELNFVDEFDSKLSEYTGSRFPSNGMRVGVLLLAFITLSSLSSIGNYVNLIRSPQYKGSESRVPFAPTLKAINAANLPDQSKVYIITQHKSGFEYYVLRYEMISAKFGRNAFSVGSPFGDGDVWTDPTMDAKTWSQTLQDYDFVVLHNSSESFNNEFVSLFESGIIEENSVYRVQKTRSGVSLSKVD
jgi:hypothetical protein